MKYSTIDTVIVSGGMIQKDFALDFIRSLKEKRKEKIEKERERCVVEVSLWRGALVLLEQKIA